MPAPENPLQQLALDRLGTVVDGRWQLDTVLGVGGMATVFGARHRNGKRVAIKLLHPHLALMPQAVSRFVREGYAANLVEHPGAVSVLDDGTLEGVPFLVMEYLEGETVDARCDRLEGRMALPDALAVGDAVLAVLEAAHARGMVHRDIKPENLFLTVEGAVKVLDFGVARLAELVGTGESGTQSGSSLGTPAFMPPEQARGHREGIDARTDLWAAGAALFYMISGRFVHDAGSVNELLVRTMTSPARSLSTVSRKTPPAIVAVIDRALSFHSNDRWPSAAAMREALRAASVESGIDVPDRPSLAGFIPPAPPPRSSFASAAALSGPGPVSVGVVVRPPAPPASGPTEDPAVTRIAPPSAREEEPVTTGTYPPVDPRPGARRTPVLVALAAFGVVTVGAIALYAMRESSPSSSTPATPARPAASSSAGATPPVASSEPTNPSPDSLPPAANGGGKTPTRANKGTPVPGKPPPTPLVSPPPATPPPGGRTDIGDSRN